MVLSHAMTTATGRQLLHCVRIVYRNKYTSFQVDRNNSVLLVAENVLKVVSCGCSWFWRTCISPLSVSVGAI